MNQTPPTKDYMWRSDTSVQFLHQGLRLFLAGVGGNRRPADDGGVSGADRLRRAASSTPITANAATSATSATSSASTSYTGERQYLDEALRLFRELRTKLSTGHLFDQGGKPLDPDPPFIDEDQRGLKVGYAKPYIIGYALAGLPDLIQFAPGRTGPQGNRPGGRGFSGRDGVTRRAAGAIRIRARARSSSARGWSMRGS